MMLTAGWLQTAQPPAAVCRTPPTPCETPTLSTTATNVKNTTMLSFCLNASFAELFQVQSGSFKLKLVNDRVEFYIVHARRPT